MSKIKTICAILTLTLAAGCYNPFSNPFGLFGGGGDDGDRPSLLPDRVVDPTEKLYLAIGGSEPGADELIIYDDDGEPRDFSGVTLECESDLEIVRVLPRPGYDTAAAGSGVRIVPTDPGVAAITCEAAGETQGVYEVTVPPQSLVQILVAEARGAIVEDLAEGADEGANQDAEDSLDTRELASPTATALGSVVRNRIWFSNNHDDVELFGADPDEYDEDPPTSYYDSIIMAEGQFAPTDPDDPNYDVFLDAERRVFLSGDDQQAYDQAVITAAGIFNGDVEDNTTGAFAFYTPTQDEWDQLSRAWSMFYWQLPDDCGVADEDYPAFDPLQVLIHPDVPTGSMNVPYFVFVRMRTLDDFAVVKIP